MKVLSMSYDVLRCLNGHAVSLEVHSVPFSVLDVLDWAFIYETALCSIALWTF